MNSWALNVPCFRRKKWCSDECHDRGQGGYFRTFGGLSTLRPAIPLFCAFEEETDNNIDLKDVQNGALHPEKGAIQQLGLKL
jgi:hypothetical protein